MATRKTQQEMFPLIAQWEQSGASREDFCATHQISLSAFAYWRGKYLKAQNQSPESGFVKLQPEWANDLEVIYPNGVRLKIPCGTSLSDVRTLIELV